MGNNRIRFMTVILILIVLLVRPGLAQTECSHYVAPDGNDAGSGTLAQPWKTLQHAADLAQAGDVVCVGTGIYPSGADDLVFSTAGTPDEPITFTTYDGAATIHGSVLFEPGSAHLRFHGFTVTGFAIWGVQLAGAEDIVLSGLDVYGGESGIVFSVAQAGGEYPVDTITVRDSVIHDVIYTAVDCTPGPCNNMIFQGLEIYGAGLDEANYGSDGLAVERGENILVEDCYVHGNSGDGIDLNSRDLMGGYDSGVVIVRRNRVEHNALNGIKVWHGGEIVNNLTFNTGDTALVIEEGSDYVIVNNTFANATSYTYLATIGYDEWPDAGETHVILRNNIFYTDHPEMDGTTLYISPRVNLVADDNLFFNPQREEDVICVGDTCFNAAQINDGMYFAQTGYGEHSLYANPLFVDVANGDLRLSEESPALDVGGGDGAPDHDLENNPRPIGDGVDIGAYETQQ